MSAPFVGWARQIKSRNRRFLSVGVLSTVEQKSAIINHTTEKNGVFQPYFSIDYRLTIVLNYLWFMIVP